MRFRFSRQAAIDLEEIGDYIATENPRRAVSFIEEFRWPAPMRHAPPKHLMPRPLALAKARLPPYFLTMSATYPRPQSEPAETDEQRQARLAEEKRLLEEAEAEADARLLISQAEANAWISSLGTANPLPMPQPRIPD